MIDSSVVNRTWDVIIIGAGAAGAAAALGLRDKHVIMLDVGISPPPNPLPDSPLYALRESQRDLHSVLLGEQFESLAPIRGEEISPKLKAPFIRYLSKRPRGFPVDEEVGFKSVQSFAIGGLANAWGAGVLRYNDADLKGFPFGSSELAPLYDELTDHIGISGSSGDDLTEYLGSTYGLLPPTQLSPIMESLLGRYEKRRSKLHAQGVRIGRTRAAILTRPFRARKPFRAFGQDFMWGPQESIYSPLFTIRELISAGHLNYQANVRVSRFEERNDFVVVHAQNLANGHSVEVKGSRIILAAGALNTARIALTSANDTATKLPLLDNAVTFVPVIDPFKIGTPLQTDSYIGGELLMVAPGERPERPIQGSIYGLLGPLRTDLLREFPLSIRGNLAASRYLVPALMMVQLFYPDDPSPQSTLRLKSDGGLNIVRAGRLVRNRERDICRTLRGLGYVALEQLCVRPSPGSSIHYAGTLPMSMNPQSQYSTDQNGRLETTTRVYVADAATFPSLPAKNHTFTLMANALRIGKHVGQTLSEPTTTIASTR